MNLRLLTPKQSLNKAYLKEKISRTDIELFKTQFSGLLEKINDKGDEEHLKSLVADFLKFTWYKDAHQINPIGKNDLVIHIGKLPSDPIGVIIEVKSVVNRGEMISEVKPNTKAIHELILYYLHERITNNKHDLKQLIATNIFEWYIFDANEFDKKIYRNTAIKKLYEQKKADNKDNPWFYEEIKKLLGSIELNLDATYFDVRDYKKQALNSDTEDDKKLIPLFKILSPVHLLKLSFTNDSNTLQPKFYSELLHIIGLYEYKEGSKKLISRKKDGERNAGSLLENAIVNLDSHDKISRLDKPSQYGENYQERLYNVALELVITWVNRILFLKLLEAQLLNYHKGNKSYNFLNKEKIRDYDELDKLFFRVLAKRVDERSQDVMQLFGKVPYLNSSLFEPTELEHTTIFISGLEDFITLPVISSTILKDGKGKTLRGDLNSIDYLFEFLNAYDFSSEGAEEIQEDNKTLINASVLGLIFEKINGYKDGSFFTPGFITMYMCRQTIRRAVVQKFNEVKGWDIKEYAELYDVITDRTEANLIVNSLKICDPAVGSGHFLVSALNELLAIKSDLNILTGDDGRTLRDITVEVINDELIITDENGDPFKYNYQESRSQNIQKTLFHQKQLLIENCLFGVDINPNSVKICRLRLWIELLKNAYYKPQLSGAGELETLPNIDINIKTGNSLISRFALDTDLKDALRNTKWNINDYKNAVSTYKNATDKAAKRELVTLIEGIKANFRSSISRNAKEYKDLSKLRGQLDKLLSSNEDLFGEKKRNKKDLQLEKNRLEIAIEKQLTAIEEIKNNKIFENAFEWRFEFPEVLDNEGTFLGFDAILGNPPYIVVKGGRYTGGEFSKSAIEYIKLNYTTGQQQINTYTLFIELTKNILGRYGVVKLIVPNTFLANEYSIQLRKFLLENFFIDELNNVGSVFEDAGVEAIILGFSNLSNQSTYITNKGKSYFIDLNEVSSFTSDNKFLILLDKTKSNVIKKLNRFPRVSTYARVWRGLTTGNDNKYLSSKSYDNKNYKPLITGADIERFKTPHSKKYVLYIPSELDRPRDERIFNLKEKLLSKFVGTKLCFSYDDQQLYVLNSACITELTDASIDIKFVLGVLNSTLMNFYFKNVFTDYRETFPIMKSGNIEDLPFSKGSENLRSDITQIVSKLSQDNIETSEVFVLERRLDELVYQLYDLSSDEISIIEADV
jgi:adenine-specific DNA-methyltransferase